jgi:hypothetical protein
VSAAVFSAETAPLSHVCAQGTLELGKLKEPEDRGRSIHFRPISL